VEEPEKKEREPRTTRDSAKWLAKMNPKPKHLRAVA